ncbi:hypothetical protein QEH56_21120 [Pelagicoccus enzymogenes]|uniref:HipA family kinase n=1 Tax=Pelagicoccus enzymogenes TaxID=2773457 RepID=UPI00280FA2BB|nr:HipA family kinase [Pelagicoccus enzymogenes]MDQ8200682.1 hypothetical protein [Pelagicoccus enzymogenes]
MLTHVEAVSYLSYKSTGKTAPLVLECEDSSGETFEVVTKLKGHGQVFPGVFVCEAFASMVAAFLGLPVPKPFVVKITDQFARSAIGEVDSETLNASLGLNFGTQHWASGYAIWSKRGAVSKDMFQLASSIFAFDGLIQNPDRRDSNPNLVTKGSDYLLFDHDSAFSHFHDIFVTLPPWEEDSVEFLKEHVLRNGLRSQLYRSGKKVNMLDLDELVEKFRRLDRQTLDSFSTAIPSEWDSPTLNAEGIVEYLLSCVEHLDDIVLLINKEA